LLTIVAAGTSGSFLVSLPRSFSINSREIWC
jgi:hypothetical protein